MLPGWFGAGSGFEAVRGSRGIELLRRAYAGWPFFRSLVDDIEAMLGRADVDISACYDELAARPASLQYTVRELAMFVYDEPMGPQGEYLTYKILPIGSRLS